MNDNAAFYLVVDELLEPVASIVACRIFDLWQKPVHIFVEGRASRKREMSPRPSIFYHENVLGALVPEGLPEDTKWPRIVYARIFAPRFLSHYSRLIYLDADILPLATDQRIWTMPLEHGVGVVQDCGRLGEVSIDGLSRRDWLRSIGVLGDHYFNSGVLVLDTAHWLTIDFDSQLRSYASRYGSATTYFDQDFLNFALQGQWTVLSPAWNFQACLFPLGLEEICPPIFLHFSKYEKPWLGQFDPSIEDIDKLGFEHLTGLAALLGFDLAPLRRTKKVDPLSRMKNRLRRHLSQCGLQSGKERRLRRAAQRQRADVLAHLAHFRPGDGAFLSDRPLLFDGKVLRMPASDFMRDLLLQPLRAPAAFGLTLPQQVSPSGSAGPSED